MSAASSSTDECEYCPVSHRGELLEFATQVTRDPKRLAENHLDAPQTVGYDDANIVRLLLVTTAAISANTIADALNILPADREKPFG